MRYGYFSEMYLLLGQKRPFSLSVLLLCCFIALFFLGCRPNEPEGRWDYEIDFGDDLIYGVMKMEKEGHAYSATLVSMDWGTFDLGKDVVNGGQMSASFDLFGNDSALKGSFQGDTFSGILTTDQKDYPFLARKQPMALVRIDRSQISYVLSETDLPANEKNIDHAGLIADADLEGFKRGERIYSSNCINCHGNPEVEGSIPLSTKFWEQPLKAGSDAYSIYQTLSRGVEIYAPPTRAHPSGEIRCHFLYTRRIHQEQRSRKVYRQQSGLFGSAAQGHFQGPGHRALSTLGRYGLWQFSDQHL